MVERNHSEEAAVEEDVEAVVVDLVAAEAMMVEVIMEVAVVVVEDVVATEEAIVNLNEREIGGVQVATTPTLLGEISAIGKAVFFIGL